MPSMMLRDYFENSRLAKDTIAFEASVPEKLVQEQLQVLVLGSIHLNLATLRIHASLNVFP
jgi:hypothetical protein